MNPAKTLGITVRIRKTNLKVNGSEDGAVTFLEYVPAIAITPVLVFDPNAISSDLPFAESPMFRPVL